MLIVGSGRFIHHTCLNWKACANKNSKHLRTEALRRVANARTPKTTRTPINTESVVKTGIEIKTSTTTGTVNGSGVETMIATRMKKRRTGTETGIGIEAHGIIIAGMSRTITAVRSVTTRMVRTGKRTIRVIETTVSEIGIKIPIRRGRMIVSGGETETGTGAIVKTVIVRTGVRLTGFLLIWTRRIHNTQLCMKAIEF